MLFRRPSCFLETSIIACAIFPFMSISRRQFFRGLSRHGEDRQQEYRRRVHSVESYVRTNLLPYDFSLTGEQAAEALGAAVEGIDITTEGELLGDMHVKRLREIVDEKVERWRAEYLTAEEARREAVPFVREFLSQAKPEDLCALKQRFQIPNAVVPEEEIERQVRVWLSGLTNGQLAVCNRSDLRELVFSELRSRC